VIIRLKSPLLAEGARKPKLSTQRMGWVLDNPRIKCWVDDGNLPQSSA